MSKFYMSREGREIFNLLQGPGIVDYPEKAALCDTLALMFTVPTLRGLLGQFDIAELIYRKPGLKDCPTVRFTDFLEGYEYVTTQFVTRDFSRIEMLKLAKMVREYDPRVIKRLGDKCKHLHHFTIPYLYGALEQEGSQVIEEIRTEARIEQEIANTKSVDLPSFRPTDISARLREIEQERIIDDALRGK